MPVWHPEMQSDADPPPGDAGPVSSLGVPGVDDSGLGVGAAAAEDDIIHRAADEILLRSESVSPEPDDEPPVAGVAGRPVLYAGTPSTENRDGEDC